MVTWVVVVALIVVVAVVVLVGAWAYQTANRLDRLHVRYDLSWQALDSALARRAVVARAVAVDAYQGGPQGARLAALADAAERASRPAREAAENDLSAALARVDPASLPVALIAELADAEARVLLARRFHNDAVRDTLALRERPAVRLLRLGGTAALPSYFEIVERAAGAGWPATSDGGAGWPATSDGGAGWPATSDGGAGWPATSDGAGLVPAASDAISAPVAPLDLRTSARVVLLDTDGAVLLLCGSDPAADPGTAPRWWFTVGGAVQEGETLPQTAAREVAEETGLSVDPADMIGPVWRREAVFDFNATVIRSEELFFVHRTRRFDPTTSGQTALERRYIHGHRWCDAATIGALAAGGETVYPLQLGELLAQANALADDGGPPTVTLQSIR